MSDEPPSYFVNGVELLGFRREPRPYYLISPDEVPMSKNARRRHNRYHSSRKGKIIARDGDKCHYCTKKLVRGGPNPPTVEHVVPRSLGGSNEMLNLVLACESCNTKFGSEYVKCKCVFCRNARFMFENGVKSG